jgi:hypothetical protein
VRRTTSAPDRAARSSAAGARAVGGLGLDPVPLRLDAAEAFLDTDQRGPARGALSEAQQITAQPPTGADSARAELVHTVILTRGYVDLPGTGYVIDEVEHRWLRDHTTRSFVVRQQFKVWSDLVEKARAAGAEAPDWR